MKNFKKINKTLDKAICGLTSDIERAEADIERNNGHIDKLREQIAEFEQQNETLTQNIEQAESLKKSIQAVRATR